MTTPDKSRPRENGVAELMTDLTSTFGQPLDEQTLCDWHQLIIAGDPEIKEIGHYRTDLGAMNVVSGPIGHERIHYTAPPSKQVPAEMGRLIAWFNSSRSELSALTRAGLAHLRFETIHPLEDGNGRIGRAIAQKALGQAVGSAPIAMLSEVISRAKNAYDALNAAQRGGDQRGLWRGPAGLGGCPPQSR